MAALSFVRAKVWLLLLKSYGGVLGSLSLNVIREICLYFKGPHFAAISGRRMEIYDFNTNNSTPHTLSISVCSGYVQVDRTTVLIVGKKVRTLDLLTLQITRLAPLRTPRNGVGAVQVDKTVYAFGGCKVGGPMRVCEKSSVPPREWTPLPFMCYARSCFTPCAFKALLYLVSTNPGLRAVESFSLNTETFTVLPISLPAELELDWSSVAFVANGELFLLTGNKQMARWTVEREPHFLVSSVDRRCWSYQPPLIVGTEVYIANVWTVEKWSLKQSKFV